MSFSVSSAPAAAAPPLVFRVATEADRAGIRRLNHQTFAEEIPQHVPREDGELPDRFEDDTTFVVAVEGERVVGMIGVSDRRPFSLDHKLPDLDAYLPPARHVCELRLLAVEPSRRGGVVFHGLGKCLAEVCAARGYDLAVISGTTRQLRLYRHLGFEPFGPLVGAEGALYQPMYLTLDRFRHHAATFGQAAYGQGPAFRPPAPHRGHNRTRPEKAPPEPASFRPGPVALWPGVRAALAEPPLSHRSAAFKAELRTVRRRLCALTGAADVQVLVGSATLANDAVAGQLLGLGTPGAVLTCGEFGERLADHAARWRLPHTVAHRPWGDTFGAEEVQAALDGIPPGGWLWATLCETSTGVLLDAAMLRAACEARGVRLVLDAVSAVGNVPVNLSGVFLASATSGKGLGAPAGLALVFHEAPVAAAPYVPRYLDLSLYAQGEGVAFTHSGPLVRALGAALDACDWPGHLAQIAADGAALRADLFAAGLHVLPGAADATPAVTTVVLPEGICSEAVGAAMADAGFSIGFESTYLRTRGWVQVCLMGDYARERLPALVAALAAAVGSAGRPAA
jgi:aspartate aminotransferase-like enzyme/GNAT superfamily N-acetyltransferase